MAFEDLQVPVTEGMRDFLGLYLLELLDSVVDAQEALGCARAKSADEGEPTAVADLP